VLDNIWNYAQQLDHSHEDRCLAATPLFYTTANYWVMLVALMHGACILPLLEFTPDEVLTTIDREKVTLVVGIPNQFITYLNHPRFGSYSLQSVRRIWSGGAMLPLELAEKLVEGFELDSLHQVYGMTETGGITTVTPADLGLEEMVATVGRPLPGFELRLVDPSTGENVGPGREGELWVRSPYNPPGYYGMSAHDSSAYFADGGWFRTGDIMAHDERDNYFFRGRIKDMIKVKGENVAAREIEIVLFSHPQVVQAAVVGVPDPVRNEAVVAFIQTNGACDEDDILELCRSRLAPYKVPTKVIFRDNWPTTGTGKIQKYVLIEELTSA
jgi:fatty-acyl-CoA synthase